MVKWARRRFKNDIDDKRALKSLISQVRGITQIGQINTAWSDRCDIQYIQIYLALQINMLKLLRFGSALETIKPTSQKLNNNAWYQPNKQVVLYDSPAKIE